MFLIFAFADYHASGGANDLIATRNTLQESVDLIKDISELYTSNAELDDNWRDIDNISCVLERDNFQIFDTNIKKIVMWYKWDYYENDDENIGEIKRVLQDVTEEKVKV